MKIDNILVCLGQTDYFIIYSVCGMINYTGQILDLRPANERHCYKVTASLIGWAQS